MGSSLTRAFIEAQRRPTTPVEDYRGSSFTPVLRGGGREASPTDVRRSE